jgi:hypothetical protein
VQRYGREAADGCEPRFRKMLADYFESAQVPPDELDGGAAELQLGAGSRSTNCTVHALRRRPLGASVPRAPRAAGGGDDDDGGGGDGAPPAEPSAKKRRLVRVL